MTTVLILISNVTIIVLKGWVSVFVGLGIRACRVVGLDISNQWCFSKVIELLRRL